jgi:hypothetical protein
MSETEKRDKGKPSRDGNSQARAFTSTITLGGKAGRPPASGLLFEARQPELKETLSPLADDLAREVQARGNDVIGETLSSVENNLSADNITIR